MFLGQYQHTLDDKGRLTIPSRFRELLVANGAYITLGFDHNLLVLTDDTFNLIYERVNKMSVTEPSARLLKRQIFSHAERVDIDKAGRILIPDFLRQHAGLQEQVVVVGSGEYIEIWSPENWTEQEKLIGDNQSNAQRFALLDLPL